MKTITTILLIVITCVYSIFTFTDIQATEVIPPEYTSITGTATFTGPLANTPRTYQLLIQNTHLQRWLVRISLLSAGGYQQAPQVTGRLRMFQLPAMIYTSAPVLNPSTEV